MARPKFKIDHAGMAEILNSAEVAQAVHAVAEKAAAEARGSATVQRHEAEVVVDDYTTDRAASSVTIAHPGGLGMEAKYGVLSRSVGGAE